MEDYVGVTAFESHLKTKCEEVASMKASLVRGRAYLRTLKDECRELEKVVDAAEDSVAETRFAAKRAAAQREAERILSSAGAAGRCSSTSADHQAELAERTGRLSAKCVRMLASVKALTVKSAELKEEISRVEAASKEEAELAAEFASVVQLLAKREQTLLETLDDFGAVFELNRVAVARTGAMEAAMLRLRIACREFDVRNCVKRDIVVDDVPAVVPRESVVFSWESVSAGQDGREQIARALTKLKSEPGPSAEKNPQIDEEIHDSSAEKAVESVDLIKGALSEVAMEIEESDKSFDEFSLSIELRLRTFSAEATHEISLDKEVSCAKDVSSAASQGNGDQELASPGTPTLDDGNTNYEIGRGERSIAERLGRDDEILDVEEDEEDRDLFD